MRDCRLKWQWLLAGVALAASLCGCKGGSGGSKETVITLHPKWNYDKFQRIAVVPMGVDSAVRGPEQAVAREAAAQAGAALSDRLAANGQFTVVALDSIKDVLAQQDLSRVADLADPGTQIPAGKIQAAQALVVSRITNCDLKQVREERRHPIYMRDMNGRLLVDRLGRPRISGERVTNEFRHEARVSASVRVIDAATAETLLAYNVPPVVMEKERDNSPPEQSPRDLAVLAARQIGVEFANRIAPQQIKVKLKSDMLTLATGYYDGAYEKLKTVNPSLEKFLVVVGGLPAPCERNPFRVAIVEEGNREVLVEQEFIWTGSSQRGVSIEVPVAKLVENGSSVFQAKLYSVGDDRPLLTREIQMEVPKGEKGRKKKPQA